jgi:hypothetical protein
VVAITASVGLVLLLVLRYMLLDWKRTGMCCSCLAKKPEFQVGDWVSVARDGNRLGRKTLGQVTKVDDKTFSQGMEHSRRAFFYSIKFPSSGPAADQQEEWLTPATAPTDEEAQSASA